MGGLFNYDLYVNPCELVWILQTRWILGALQVLVNMVITVMDY